MNSYMGLPVHHLCTPFELSMTMIVPSTTGSSEDSDGWVEVDSSRLHSLEDLCQFMTMDDYPFGYHTSDEDDYDPSHECFHMKVEETAPRDATPIEQGTHTPRQQVFPTVPPQGRATVSAPEGSQ
jgi:hypothetical protein